jgi:hypothetical protein
VISKVSRDDEKLIQELHGQMHAINKDFEKLLII